MISRRSGSRGATSSHVGRGCSGVGRAEGAVDRRRTVSIKSAVSASASFAQEEPGDRNSNETGGQVSSLQKLYHVFFFVYTFVVWGWHFTPAAAYLPGASGYGFFFRYMTFCGYTAQLVGLGLSAVSDFNPKAKKLKSFADDFSCAVFAIAHVITLMYYGIMMKFPNPIEGSNVDRPFWLGFSVHGLNSIVAWGDVLVSNNRSFTRRSAWFKMLFSFLYLIWVHVVRHVTGIYPYPFLNKLPFPSGILVMIAISNVVMIGFHFVGRAVCGAKAKVLS